MKLSNNPIVEVVWQDFMHHGNGWREPEFYLEQTKDTKLEHYSVGYLLVKTKDYVVIYQSKGESNIAEVSQIPRSAIVSIKTLRK